MIPTLERFDWGTPSTFLGLPPDANTFADSTVTVLPVPYEATVSYQTGTRFGPRAIIDASRYIELYDHQLDREPYTVGVHTLPELSLTGEGPREAHEQLREVCDEILARGKFLVMLGGEHSISSAPILSHVDRLQGRRLSVLQLDAHSDLRPEYEGTAYSHASVMHRVHEVVDIVQVGIRSLTAEERELIRSANIEVVFGHELEEEDGWDDRALNSLAEDVYITFDVDFFDPSIIPATGTPEPGGGRWNPTIAFLERVFKERNVVGCDIVELAPKPGDVAADFTVAKLAYKMIGFHSLRIS